MKLRYPQAARWLLCACTALMLVACGGGGGGGEAQEQPRDDSNDAVIPAPPPPAADLRNGSYTMVASDGYEYTLTLDFDAKTYKVAGNGINDSGAIEASGSEFEFKPGNAEGSSGFNTIRFAYVDNTVVGVYVVPAGPLPFIAARSFATSLPGTSMTFNLLGRWVDTADVTASSTSVQQAQITSDGWIRICESDEIPPLETCPVGDLFEAPLTVAGNQFSYAANEDLTVVFRLAQVGTDPIFLRASPSNGTTRRFIMGMPAVTSFDWGSFVGGTAAGAWATVATQANSIVAKFTGSDAASLTASGTVTVGEGTFGSLATIESEDLGRLYGISSTKLGFIVAAPDSVKSTGGIFLGVRQ